MIFFLANSNYLNLQPNDDMHKQFGIHRNNLKTILIGYYMFRPVLSLVFNIT